MGLKFSHEACFEIHVLVEEDRLRLLHRAHVRRIIHHRYDPITFHEKLLDDLSFYVDAGEIIQHIKKGI
ncbi:hypothetical protein BS627_02920 [Agrobacterium salinitolerans]|uniref:Uncharacterized protein n=1 Tax=Agrobacterium pusense TaxID=648995 RepID=U4Q7W4_9HYPH|nr:hypothetical protein BS627_02920 [Agrobacterium salinitolerans]PNQ25589.1 hypothetical protein C2E26_02975 [Rhizobium sp. YIC5082]CDI12157.1 protein of unknown function [Agrobacterium pusense]